MNPNETEIDPAQPTEEPAAPSPKPRRRRAPAATAPAPAADAPPLAAEEVVAVAADRPAAPHASQADADGDAGEGELHPAVASDGPDAVPRDEFEGEPGSRRTRNRRRGRRGDRRAAGDAESTDPAAGAAPAEGAAEPGQPGRPGAARLPAVDVAETFADVLSGAYDALPVAPEESQAAAESTDGEAAERRVLAPEPDAPKLHKLLAQSGIGSRRDMEQLIEEGQVTVNDQVAHIGQRVSWGDQVRVSGRLVKLRIAPPLPRVLAYHKPVGEVVTLDDPQNRPTVFRRLPRLAQGKWQSVGRLDINTEGLLLFTTSGDLANQLMHPRFGVEREYAVRVLGTLDAEARARLVEGVEIDGQRAAFKSIEDGGGEGANHWYRVVITEGRNREVRKLFDRVGLVVSRLIRIRYGCVVLPRGLKRGVWVDLNEVEVRELRRLAGHRPQHPAAAQAQSQPPGEGGEGGRRNRRRRRGGRPEDMPVEGSFDRPEPAEDFARIPNPLQQTFDKRAIREARQPRREYSDDGPIPNPLEQTYDKRFVQKSSGPGAGRGKRGGEPGQPDPMRTSVGYIGADAFVRKFQGGGGGGGRGGKRRGGRR